jgi:hypothetical protein
MRQSHYVLISRRTQLHNLRRVKQTLEILKQGSGGETDPGTPETGFRR